MTSFVFPARPLSFDGNSAAHINTRQRISRHLWGVCGPVSSRLIKRDGPEAPTIPPTTYLPHGVLAILPSRKRQSHSSNCAGHLVRLLRDSMHTIGRRLLYVALGNPLAHPQHSPKNCPCCSKSCKTLGRRLLSDCYHFVAPFWTTQRDLCMLQAGGTLVITQPTRGEE